MTVVQELVNLNNPVQEKSFSPYNFFTRLRNLYLDHDVDPNGNEMHFFSEGHINVQKLYDRSNQFLNINNDILSAVSEEFGDQSNESIACTIGYLLTEPTNNLFIKLLEERQNGKNSLSWIEIGENEVKKIQEIVTNITETPRFISFFIQCPEVKKILHIFAFGLSTEQSFERRIELLNEIDRLSWELYDRNLPTLIVPESTYYTDMYPPLSEDGWVPEPTLRWIIPTQEKEHLESIQKDIWTVLCREHNESIDKPKPHVFVGWQMITCGSDIPSLSTAEWLSPNSILFIPYAYKSIPFIEKMAQLSNIMISREEIIAALYYIYQWHEFGHAFYNLLQRDLEELDTDITTILGVLEYGNTHGISRMSLLLSLFGEYARQSIQPVTTSVVIDGYRKSGRYIAQMLIDQQFVQVTDTGFCFFPDKRLNRQRLIHDHNGIHGNNQEIIKRLKEL